MTRKERAACVMDYFAAAIPVVATELNYDNPYQLIVAVILSAQCTDKRVNLTTPDFFRYFPDFKTLAKAKNEDVFQLIKSISYPNNKTKHLIKMAQMVMKTYGGNLPSEAEELQKLPGVGRKTANVVSSVLFNTPAIAVDTHVFRVSARIGLTKDAKNPRQTEMQLMKIIPHKYLPDAHHWLILHGRYVCKARKPECYRCGITHCCLFFRKLQRANLVPVQS